MDPFPLIQEPPSGLLYRLNTGIGLRVSGDNARNDGILGELDIGYMSRPFFDYFSLESGTSIDLFGETEHLAGYIQLNYQPTRLWIFSLRSQGGGVMDNKEKPTGSVANPSTGSGPDDTDDFGGIFDLAFQTSYRIDERLWVGVRTGFEIQAYGKSGGDQGTQYGLANYLNIAYVLPH